jgi:Protein of unknown function (DUF4019)
MRKIAVLSLLVICFTARLALAQDAEDKARFAAEQWIVLVDDGQYDQSWTEASKTFQSATTKEDWSKKAQADRTFMGSKLARKLKEVKPVNAVKGLPSGQYIQVKYQSSYTNKKQALETVVAVNEDGNWRVAAYIVN